MRGCLRPSDQRDAASARVAGRCVRTGTGAIVVAMLGLSLAAACLFAAGADRGRSAARRTPARRQRRRRGLHPDRPARRSGRLLEASTTAPAARPRATARAGQQRVADRRQRRHRRGFPAGRGPASSSAARLGQRRAVSVDRRDRRSVTVASWVYLEGNDHQLGHGGVAADRQQHRAALSRLAERRREAEPVRHHRHVGGRLLSAQDVGAAAHLAPSGRNLRWDERAALRQRRRSRRRSAVTGTFAPDTTPLIIGGNGNDATGVFPPSSFPAASTR